MALDLRLYTPARVGLGRRGNSLPTSELLQFDLDHARARDAVQAELDPGSLPFSHVLVSSRARDRRTFLLRPDLGRQLETPLEARPCDAVIVLADGLSALAAHRHGPPLLALLEAGLAQWRLGPTIVARQARVALGDHIGHQLGARLCLMLIGERPGLSSPDSLGAYLTWDPRPGRTDAERNCVSNIRPEGLSYAAAAALIVALMNAARSRQLTGVTLKADADTLALAPSRSDS
jgi:ethanolamine ammonia-lyase small subunit